MSVAMDACITNERTRIMALLLIIVAVVLWAVISLFMGDG